MASSSTSYSSKHGNSGHIYRLKLNIKTTSQSTSDNTSTVRIRAWIQSFNNSSFNITSSYEGRFSGTELTSGSKRFSCPGNGELLVFDYDRTVSHNSSGDRTVAASAEFSNSYTGSHSAWTSLKLDRIGKLPDAPRSAPTVSRSGTKITVVSATADGNGSPITDYQARRRNNGSGSYGGWFYSSGKSYTFNSANLGADYQFQSRASTTAGWGPWSETTTFHMPDDTSGVGTIQVTLAPGSVAGAWEAPETTETVTGYRVYLHDGTSWGAAVLLPGDQYSYEWDSLSVGTYKVGVEAVYTSSSSPRSESDLVYLGTVPATIGAVTLSDEGDAAWSAPSDGGTPILNYEVEWWDGIEWVPGEPTTSLSVAYEPAPIPGIGYRSRVRAVNAVGPAEWATSGYVCLVDCGCLV